MELPAAFLSKHSKGLFKANKLDANTRESQKNKRKAQLAETRIRILQQRIEKERAVLKTLEAASQAGEESKSQDSKGVMKTEQTFKIE